MRNAIKKALAITAVIAGSVLVPASAVADDPPFVVANAASYQSSPVAGGALWAIYTHDRVSPEESWVYSKWTTTPNYGLVVEASCDGENAFMPLPVLYVGFAYGGNQINAYKPNSLGTEQWGSCAYTGPAKVRIHTSTGGTIEGGIVVLPAHPGIFSVGISPAGDHIDGNNNHTPLSECPSKILADPRACPVRTGFIPSELWLSLTGAEWFLCDPCGTSDIRFELGPSPDAPDSAWVRQSLRRLATVSPGVEQAMITLNPSTAPGLHYLRVRNNFRPEYPKPLPIELGQPS